MKTGVEFYLVVTPKDRRWPRRGLRTPRVTKKKPGLQPGSVALRFTLSLPISLFEEFLPAGHIEIPEGAPVGRPTMRVEVPADVRLDEPRIRLQLVAVDDP